jgi:hypothetical protein
LFPLFSVRANAGIRTVGERGSVMGFLDLVCHLVLVIWNFARFVRYNPCYVNRQRSARHA